MQQRIMMSVLSPLLMAGICSMPELHAQQNSAPAQQPPVTAQQPANPQPASANSLPGNVQAAPSSEQNPGQNTSQNPPQQQNQPQPMPNPSGTTVNPSQAPLQPVTTYPDAGGAQQEQPSSTQPAQTTLPENPQPKPLTEPVGAAAAEGVTTAGGAAAKPAGAAIAPAKQHQTRSLMIKIGAALAAGAALGTVFALSHSTSSLPPGTGMTGVTGR